MYGELFNPYRTMVGIHIPEGLVRCKDVSDGAKITYGRLLRYAGENGRCYPAVATLSKEIASSERQTQRYLLELESFKLIVRMKRFADDGNRGSNFFGFLRHAILDDKDDLGGDVIDTRGGDVIDTRGGDRIDTQRESSFKESHSEEKNPPTPLEPFSKILEPPSEDSVPEEKQAPDATTADVDLDSPLEKFAHNCVRPGRPKLELKSNQYLLQDLLRQEEQYGVEPYRLAMLAWSEDKRSMIAEWFASKKQPFLHFKKHVEEYLPDAVKQPRREAEAGQGAIAGPVPGGRTPKNAPAVQDRVSRAQGFMDTWNRIVTDKPFSDPISGRCGWPDFPTEQEFTEKWEAVCRKVQHIQVVNKRRGVDAASWMDLRWCVNTDKTKGEGWRNLLGGKYDYILAPRNQAERDHENSELADALIAEKFEAKARAAEEAKKNPPTPQPPPLTRAEREAKEREEIHRKWEADMALQEKRRAAIAAKKAEK